MVNAVMFLFFNHGLILVSCRHLSVFLLTSLNPSEAVRLSQHVHCSASYSTTSLDPLFTPFFTPLRKKFLDLPLFILHSLLEKCGYSLTL